MKTLFGGARVLCSHTQKKKYKKFESSSIQGHTFPYSGNTLAFHSRLSISGVGKSRVLPLDFVVRWKLVQVLIFILSTISNQPG